MKLVIQTHHADPENTYDADIEGLSAQDLRKVLRFYDALKTKTEEEYKLAESAADETDPVETQE